jgi:hypothetical protein
MSVLTDISNKEGQEVSVSYEGLTPEQHRAKFLQLSEFCGEIEPIMGQLNDLMTRYNIPSVEKFILFPISKENKITTFINYSAFPEVTK